MLEQRHKTNLSLKAVKMSLVVFCSVTGGLVGGHQRFGGTYCFHLPGELTL
jgi:hypothetical protein